MIKMRQNQTISTFTKYLKYLRNLLLDVKSATVLYDGETQGKSLLNLRDI